jgi:uncharacterized protein involved in exopolysaccharide biosynthesis
MKKILLTSGVLILSLTAGKAAVAHQSDDPLLDARLEVETLKLRYTDEAPKMTEAEVRLNAISKTFSETPQEYRAHIQERITQLEEEDAALSLKYYPVHPKRMAAEAKLSFLRQELQRASH